MPKVTIRFAFGDIELQTEHGENLLSVLRKENLPIAASCGGAGTCGKCKIKLIFPKEMLITQQEKTKLKRDHIDAGYRLACMIDVIDDIVIELPIQSSKPQLAPISQIDRYKTDDEDGYAFAFDIGTTTIAGFLLDLQTGKTIDCESSLNQQCAYGADVLSRCNYTFENENGLSLLHEIIMQQIDYLCKKMLLRNQKQQNEIIRIVLVGNPTMMQICANIDLHSIAVAPYQPAFFDSFEIQASDIGLDFASSTKACFFSQISGFLGADIVSACLANNIGFRKENCLIIDIGTNGEMVLGNHERLYACSTAAGPAFEGGKITCGVGGISGAIDQFNPEQIPCYSTIYDKPALGICGSGLIDLVSWMIHKGIIDETGKMDVENSFDEKMDACFDELGNYVIARKSEGAQRDVFLSQQDVRELQLAKAAIAAGVACLIEQADISYDEIDYVFLAGGFGSYIDYQHACNIGLVPQELIEKMQSAGNAAGVGACMLACSETIRKRSEILSKKIQYVELAQSKSFNEHYIEAMGFDNAIS